VGPDAAPAGVLRKARTRAAPGLRLVANRGRPPGAGWRRPSRVSRAATKSAARRRREDAAN